MISQKNIVEFTLEQQIVHQLLLRSDIDQDLGLYHGKMGVIIFFVHYSKLNNKELYDIIIDELMEELMEEIHVGLPVDFASGILGIGWGIEYLIQNGFMEGDSLDICEEIDLKTMKQDPRRITDYSIETGLGGLLHYVLAHIKGVMTQHSKLPFDETYLSDLHYAVSNISSNNEVSEKLKLLFLQYSHFYKNRTILNYSLKLSEIIEVAEITDNSLSNFPIGLKKGLSGFLLKNLISSEL